MKKIDLGQTINTIANIGVIAGIVFLGLEIQQSNRIALVDAEYALRNSWGTINEAIYTDPEMAAFISRMNTPGEELEDTDYERARAWTFRQLNVWIAATNAYENEIALDRTYENILENVRNEINGATPEMRGVWRQSIELFPSLASTDVFLLVDEILDGYEQAEAGP